MDIEIYAFENGKEPFTEWLQDLGDVNARARIRTRFDRIRLGNLGEYRTVNDGVFELKFDFGPGYRVYFGRIGLKMIVLLVGGDKGSQQRDISKAKEYWRDYLNVYEKKKIQKIRGRTH